MPADAKHRTAASAVGSRNGQARAKDGSFSVKLPPSRELGGADADAANPQPFFAAGYSACVIGALEAVDVAAETRMMATIGMRPARKRDAALRQGCRAFRARTQRSRRNRPSHLPLFECDAR